MTLTEHALHTAVDEWYAALDRHDDLAAVLPRLVDDGLVMRFPEGTLRGHTGFAEWYRTVTNRFFDEQHTVSSVTVDRLGDAGATVRVLVNWQAHIWDPPAARSRWLGFDAYQTWELVPGGGTLPLIKTYVVDELKPMAGSAPL